MPEAVLDRGQMVAVIRSMHRALAANREAIDELNVFPVPDGDTGTNMTLTLRAVLDEVREHAGSPRDDAEFDRRMVRAALRGARGNSGVILSQIVRAMVEAVAQAPVGDAAGLAKLLARIRDLAYEAVADPVEGTILTAMAAAADSATEAAERDEDLVAASRRIRNAVHTAVVHTREQLPELREAGVVDAGARGFEVVVEAVHARLSGVDLDEAGPLARHIDRDSGPRTTRETGSLEFNFEVQYLLEAQDEDAQELRERLQRFGDSVVVVAAGGLMTVHVHTNDVGGVIEEGLRFGQPSRIEVTYFDDEGASTTGRARAADRTAPQNNAAEDTAAADDATLAATGPQEDDDGREVAGIGIVAVLPGPGLRALAEDLGAVVVDGAAGALPSVADILNAMSDLRAERLVVLPGHRNAVPTANQASDVSVAEGGRRIDVVETAISPPAVLAALSVCDPQGGGEEVIEEMRVAASACRSGEVVAAVRDASTPIGEVREGQWLAVLGTRVIAAADDPACALDALIESSDLDAAELVMLIVGEGVEDDECAAAEAAVRKAASSAELEVIDGGQRPARYIIGVE